MLGWILLSLAVSSITIQIPGSLLGELNNAQNRTNETRLEEFFCLVGEDDGRTIRVDHLVKPTQSKYIGYKLIGFEMVFVSQVIQEAECPEGTVGDVHTHPWGSEPSRFDYAGWMNEYAFNGQYRFHAVSSREGRQNQIRFFYVHCPVVEEEQAECGVNEIIPQNKEYLKIGNAP